MSGYNLFDRLLHRLALQFMPTAELSLDLDQRLIRTNPQAIIDERHVFIAGLARAGTTVLMRQFYATGAYRSLTYRDMPFVLAPNLWRRLSRSSRRQAVTAERAHGDKILVDVDSPESFDEVFWRVFAGAEYIAQMHLRPHAPDPETTWKYVCYINAVLAAQEIPATRYLSKNNNNILRLHSIRAAFPRALIVVPFREPLAHASSLLRQHRNFARMQAEDRFVGSYMRWLGHHEFGQDHRPFRFGDEEPDLPASHGSDSIEYWLALWRETYAWLERSAPQDAVFVCYEHLCEDSKLWSRLADLAGIPTATAEDTPFASSKQPVENTPRIDLNDETQTIYARLKKRSCDAVH